MSRACESDWNTATARAQASLTVAEVGGAGPASDDMVDISNQRWAGSASHKLSEKSVREDHSEALGWIRRQSWRCKGHRKQCET